MPDFSTICRRQRTLAVSIPYHGSKGPLHLLIDSTGIKVEGEGEWNARKHGGRKRRVWREIHIGIDEQTLEIRAVEITGSNTGDAPMLPHLLNQIPHDQEIGSVTADGAYDTRRCHNAIASNDALHASRYLGRALWRNWSGYHRRSRVETKMHCMKLLGQRPPLMVCKQTMRGQRMARDFDRQVAEVQVRVAILNGYIALGIPVMKAVG